jgi:hypothetical protein
MIRFGSGLIARIAEAAAARAGISRGGDAGGIRAAVILPIPGFSIFERGSDSIGSALRRTILRVT